MIPEVNGSKQKSSVTAAPYSEVGRGKRGEGAGNDFPIVPAVRRKCRGCDFLKERSDCMCIRRQGTKGGAMTFSLSPQCRAFSRAVMVVIF